MTDLARYAAALDACGCLAFSFVRGTLEMLDDEEDYPEPEEYEPDRCEDAWL